MTDENRVVPKVALLCGISGSGKTYVAKCLEQYGFIRLSLDEELYPDYYLLSELMTDEHRAVLKEEGIKRLQSRMANLIADGRNVAVDMPFCKRAQRDAFAFLVRDKGAVPVLVFLTADFSVLRERLSKRQGRNGWENLPVSESELVRFYGSFERPTERESPVIINANEPFDAEKIAEIIKNREKA